MNFRQSRNSSRYSSPNHFCVGNLYQFNIAAVDVPDITIKVGRIKLAGPDHIRSLRKKFSATHIFVRRRDDVIDIPVVENAKILGQPEDLSLCKDLGIASNFPKPMRMRLKPTGRSYRYEACGKLDLTQLVRKEYSVPVDCAPTGIRTPVYAVRGRRPRPLDDGSNHSAL